MDQQFIDDVLCTALDSAYGGSLYWIGRTLILEGTKADYQVKCKYEVVSRGGTLVIEDDDGTQSQLNQANFEQAIQRWATDRGLNATELDAGSIDSNDADAILQLALFGEVIYS